MRATAGDYGLHQRGAPRPPGPITDDLGYRVYGHRRHDRDGYIENNGGDDLWDQDHNSWGAGAQLSWDATDTRQCLAQLRHRTITEDKKDR